MTTYRVLLADKIARNALTPLTADGQFELVERTGLQGEALAAAIAEVDAVIVRSATRITRAALSQGSRIKVIGRAGVGVDTIDVEAATEKGVAVFNAPAGNTISAAELAFALLLALVRKVAAADRSMRAGEWDRTSFNGTELYGKTLSLIGAGRVGGEVARRARAFDMRVLAYDPFLNEATARELGITLVPLDQALREADVISLHVPLTEQTRGMIDAAKLELLKKEAVIVNAARGGVLDEAALIEALQAGRVAGAALDVFAAEPLPADHPLRGLKNVVLTPHLGASTEEAQRNVAREIAEVIRAALVEGDLSGAVNAPAVGGEKLRRLRPVQELAERLGRLGAALASGPINRVEVRYAGDSDEFMRPLAAASLGGVLASSVGSGAVNLVNALHLARSRGIEVERVRTEPRRDYAEYLELRVSGSGGGLPVAGAILGEGHPRLVKVGDYDVDVAPHGPLVILRNRDVPGVIGRVGTLLGNAGVNIAGYHQARLEAGGVALAAISVDDALPPSVVQALANLPEVVEVRQVELQ